MYRRQCVLCFGNSSYFHVGPNRRALWTFKMFFFLSKHDTLLRLQNVYIIPEILCNRKRYKRSLSSRIWKYRVGSFLKNLFKNQWSRKAQVYMKAFWHSVKSNLLKSWSLGVERGHNMGNYFTCVSMGKVFKNLSKNYWARIDQIYVKARIKILKSCGRVRRAAGATVRKTIFERAFEGNIEQNLKICCTRRVQIYIEVSCLNAEMSFR
jgi:hypothetical protein